MSQIPLVMSVKYDEKVLKEKLSRSPKEERARLKYLAKKIKEGFIDNIYRVSVIIIKLEYEHGFNLSEDLRVTDYSYKYFVTYKIFGDEPEKTVEFIRRFDSRVKKEEVIAEHEYFYDDSQKNIDFLRNMAYLFRGRCGITPCYFPNINCRCCEFEDCPITYVKTEDLGAIKMLETIETEDLETKADKKSLEIKFNEFCEKEAKDIMDAAKSKLISSFVLDVKVENLESAQTQMQKATTKTIEIIKQRLEQQEELMIEEKYPRRFLENLERQRRIILEQKEEELKLLEVLIKQEQKVDVKTIEKDDKTTAHDVVTALIDVLEKNMDTIENGITELGDLFINRCCRKLEALIKEGANINIKDKKGLAPLDYLKKYPEVYKIVKERVEKAIIEYQTKKLKEQQNKNLSAVKQQKQNTRKK